MKRLQDRLFLGSEMWRNARPRGTFQQVVLPFYISHVALEQRAHTWLGVFLWPGTRCAACDELVLHSDFMITKFSH